ncbi:hypothetical protein BBJ29_007046 [Phytophthora kernoviae]|uniref:Uncharacterized protein n=1 Tax=Phytophthora kernoviae TaxID=325452 RepID=A0A3F2RGQ6_9STRA|nr:hypothetical protein BBP00_00008519 [Phytophthora kernoviae]RLN61622.1 hypothetical protein BBJ29_007046 [Phytophthora kernoviae]
MSGKHLDAVWQVRWVARGGGESVVSVSADGRVVEWSLKKGLSFSDLMTLKRAPNPLLGGIGTAATGTNGGTGGVGSDGVISRQASGRCLAFASRTDPSVYFVGTEDGLVHKCSVSYNEQYLQTDWSLKLWHQAESHGDAALTFHSVDLAQAVLGASWSPTDAALFAAVAEDGRIELWDLAQSTLDPIVRHFPKKYISVATPVPQATDGDDLLATTSSREATPKADDGSPLTDSYRDPNAVIRLQEPAKMLASGVTYGVMIATLVAVAAYAIIVSRRMEVNSVKNFVSAKNSTTALRLAWCFFSAGMGSWTLFSFPQIGVSAGSWGVIGYTLSGVSGMLVLAYVGPYTRSALGENVTMTDVVAHRFGYVMQVYIGLISVFYQFISLASELTTVAQLTTMLSPNAHSLVPILVVVFLTNLYLLIGGLRASLATDVWQGIGVIALLAVVCIAMCFHVSIPENAWSDTNVAAFTVTGFETLVTLVIAVTASNLFFTGFWQRVYAAYDDDTLRKAAYIACGIIIPFTVALGVAGMVSYLAYPDGDIFFAILIDMGHGWEVLIVIVIAMLSSGVSDSIQIGIAAELTTCFPQLNLLHARLICALLNVPAIVIAYQEYDILNLFLIADLLCTAAVGPMLLGTWKRATRMGAWAGSAAGLITIFICGVIAQGKFVGGFNWFILPEGLYSQNSMITFIVTLIIPPVVTVIVSLATPPSKEPTTDGSYLLEHSPIQGINA